MARAGWLASARRCGVFLPARFRGNVCISHPHVRACCRGLLPRRGLLGSRGSLSWRGSLGQCGSPGECGSPGWRNSPGWRGLATQLAMPGRLHSRTRLRSIGFLALLASLGAREPASAANAAPLTLEARIPLGDVSGRIDHLAFDPTRQRLYVAELGNNSIGIVDLETRKVIRTVPGFNEPQGIAYEPSTDTIYVASGGDGTTRIFRGADFTPLGALSLGTDADNVRIDREAHRVYVGYGDGALAVIDAATRTRIANIPLQGHPESFQLDPNGDRIFVNVPDAGHIAVVSRAKNQQVTTWPTGNLRANYPLALDPPGSRVIAVFRSPARLQTYDTRTGRAQNGIDVCSDSDDVFADSARHEIYVICGQGYVDVLDASGERLTSAGRFATSSGSRTGLFVPELDRLFVAIRASHDEPAAIWVLKPTARTASRAGDHPAQSSIH
ncbi:MAG TPA: YncE family protein [Steroidobacteraceae bacterium]|nr:YncE family protein [Steroidobacteraceae bacterium]